MNESNNKSVKMCSIRELLNYNFVIPSYQRGYRWRGKNGEVQALLEDIKEFIENKEKNEEYCLNPIAVKAVKKDDNKEQYNLVDGQQRLTTIYLILKYLNKELKLKNEDNNFNINYDTKEKNKDFLEKVNENTSENEYNQNIDYHHIYKAYVYIKKWFKENEIDKKDFKDNLLDNVNIIWYNVGEDDENEVFQRLNAGKIALTDSELIKAIFLHKSNFKEESSNNKNAGESKKGESNDKKNLEELKQINIANQWENIEIELENDKFWYFISNNDDNNIRMDFLFELIYNIKLKNNNTDNTKYKIFNSFYKEFKNNQNNLNEKWKELSKYFYLLKEWYEDDNLYNDIGYLIASGSRELKTILSYAEDKKLNTKQEFYTQIKKDIKESINASTYQEFKEYITQLEYKNEWKNDNEQIKKILLLFNIIESSKENTRFPFDKYKFDKYKKKIIQSLEHIHARASEDLDNNGKEQFILNNIEYIKIMLNSKIHDESNNSLKEINKKIQNINTEKIKSNLEEVFNLIKDGINEIYKNEDLEDINNISNLALIDKNHNSSLGNRIFPAKLEKIKELLKNNDYIPIATKNVFFKKYTQNAKDILMWSQIDRNSYLENIIDSIADYLELEKYKG
ncbi:DUF262 domain-containing protein [uncultured Brachyspira sp.]|uniref:DUF262 domain-containing protein n=1 Tax=uncultured Brachyspira sp. TaxID=221953 RepID=UPI00258643F2|nr:DUF262 domain-containing protein [uncultured Brachyspira sp.]